MSSWATVKPIPPLLMPKERVAPIKPSIQTAEFKPVENSAPVKLPITPIPGPENPPADSFSKKNDVNAYWIGTYDHNHKV